MNENPDFTFDQAELIQTWTRNTFQQEQPQQTYFYNGGTPNPFANNQQTFNNSTGGKKDVVCNNVPSASIPQQPFGQNTGYIQQQPMQANNPWAQPQQQQVTMPQSQGGLNSFVDYTANNQPQQAVQTNNPWAQPQQQQVIQQPTMQNNNPFNNGYYTTTGTMMDGTPYQMPSALPSNTASTWSNSVIQTQDQPIQPMPPSIDWNRQDNPYNQQVNEQSMNFDNLVHMNWAEIAKKNFGSDT